MKSMCLVLLTGLLLTSCASDPKIASREPQQFGQIGKTLFSSAKACYEGRDESGKICSLNITNIQNDFYIASAKTTSCADDSGFPIATVDKNDIKGNSDHVTVYRTVSGSKDTRTDFEITEKNNLPSSFRAAYWPSTFSGHTLKSPAAKVNCTGLKIIPQL